MSDRSGVLVRLESVAKQYGRVQALSDVSMQLRRGSIHALVGSNGAGKSTLIRLLMGLERPDRGQLVASDDQTAGVRIGYQPQVPALYTDLQVVEFLELAARIGGRPSTDRVDDVMRVFGLAGIGSQLIRTLSVGTKMKVAVAAALVQEPELLILDEPTNGVDAVGVGRLKERLREFRDAGGTVLLATHMIDFVAGLCDDITILHRGLAMYTGPVSGLDPVSQPLESRVLAYIDADAST